MIRRRFVASAVAAVAGLFGAKAGRGERAEEFGPVDPHCIVKMRIADGEILAQGWRPGSCDHEARQWASPDAVVTVSRTSMAHAVELAEAARLRYVITSAMKANV